jgi:hypothetical protein
VLDADLAEAFARVALANVQREYPRRLDQLLSGPDTQWRPRALHPAFFGSYDWHSAVHMHWLLARLLNLYPALEAKVSGVLDEHLAPRPLATELAFFRTPGAAAFERPYGWAWLLELYAELLRLNLPAWHEALEPLAGELAGRFSSYIRTLPYPVRAGTHGNSAFACVLALDYALATSDTGLKGDIEAAARRWFLADRDYPVTYEPSGEDFLSPALVEAVLMKQVLGDPGWLRDFLPAWGALAEPPKVLDHADAKQSHLDGLCLSRAWCFVRLGNQELAQRHLAAGMPHVIGGDYAGEHWLATFATLALSAEALTRP